MEQTEIDQLYALFIAQKMPKELWTHRAHFVVTTCLLLDPAVDEPMDRLRELIQTNNVYMGVANTDTSGYHETLTQFYYHEIQAILAELPNVDRYSAVAAVLQSPIVDKAYPLKFYEKTQLFSVEARRAWVANKVVDAVMNKSQKITVTNTRSGNPGQSGWNAILPAPPPPRILDENITADWLVIGGGFAGLAAARRLSQLRPEDRTVLLEAIRIGDGPAGRSSGFMIDLPHDISAESYTSALEADKKQTEMNRTALTFARELAADYDFSPEIFDPRGKINVAATDFGDHHNHEYADYLTHMGEPFSVLSHDDMRQITGTDYYSGGLHTPGSIMIQPAGFVRGLAQGLALSGAVDVFEYTPVLSMERKGDAWQVHTPNGTVSTTKIILAVNGHIQSFGFFKRRLMHVFLYGSMTRALTADEVKRLGGDPVWDAVPADPLGSTVRRISGSGGDRILMRNKFKYSASLEATERSVQQAARDHDRSFVARFPMLPDVEMEYRWGGRLCLSWNSVPVFGEVEEGVYAAVCQNGLGASKGILSGILSAEYATGMTNPYIEEYLATDPPTRLPPEPFSSIGATIYLNWKERQAGREK